MGSQHGPYFYYEVSGSVGYNRARLDASRAVPNDLTRAVESDIILDVIKKSDLEGAFNYESRKELWIKP